MWAEESVFYQIYPLGFCNAPYENDGIMKSRILNVISWMDHLKKLGINAVYFSPIFESDTHGYNTRDYRKIDVRLGTNEDFIRVCKSFHENGIKIILDGVFNHAGRGFFGFQDVIKNREQSKYRDWFYINFSGNSPYNDGFYYEGWEGNYDLVKFNLRNEEVVRYLLESVQQWINEFDIDGIRLDVAYCLDVDFIKTLRRETELQKNDFFLVGEMLHGDYNRLVQKDLLHSVTNYECYKGLHSSFNSMNLFEIVHSLLRQFGTEPWALYKEKHLLSFVDNHDVTRIATILNNKNHLTEIYTLLLTMPGIPCIYYGSEWGTQGDKADGDQALRVCFDAPKENELFYYIAKLISFRKTSVALNYGSFRSIYLCNTQCVFERWYAEERLLVAINADQKTNIISTDFGCLEARDVINNREISLQNGLVLEPYTSIILRASMN